MSFSKSLKAAVFNVAQRLGYTIKRTAAPPEPHYLEYDPAYASLIERVKPFTMTPTDKIAAMIDAVRHVTRAKIPGGILECGVWRGGSMMVAALTLLKSGDIRDLYLFDTFAGMTAPTEIDVDEQGVSASGQYAKSVSGDRVDWCYASIEDVRQNLLSTGYPEDRIHFVKGDVLQTLPHSGLGELALLRLDTDWYESTLHELKCLYPKLRSGGILIIDDYGYWQGCQKAVDEFFMESKPFLIRIDSTGRLVVKG